MGSFVYSMCTRIALLCTYLMILKLLNIYICRNSNKYFLIHNKLKLTFFLTSLLIIKHRRRILYIKDIIHIKYYVLLFINHFFAALGRKGTYPFYKKIQIIHLMIGSFKDQVAVILCKIMKMKVPQQTS